MRIGITCYPTYGGSGIVGSELGKELAKRGHDIHFIGYSLPTRLMELSDRIQFHEVEMLTYPLFEHQPYSMALATKMFEVVEAANIDLLHVHYAIPHSISAYLAREMLMPKRYLPIVTTLHGTDITLVGADRSYLPITRFGIQKSDGVTAISHYLRKATCETFGVCNIEVIPNFVCPGDYQRTSDAALRARLASPEEKIIVHVSNFRPVKRVTDCVLIFARVRKQLPGTKLVFVGDGPERAAADHMARQLGVRDSVVFAGKQPQISDYLSLSDLLLLPSETESFGLAALEAMACEVPVIVSNVGGLPEVVEQGETGYLCEVGDIDCMARIAIEILSNNDLGRKMGRRGREVALDRFASERIIPLYEAYYQQVLAQVSTAGPSS